MTKCC